MKKLWDKGVELLKEVEIFTTGKDLEYDESLAVWDILGSIAHAKMLKECNIISKEDEELISEVLQVLFYKAEKGLLVIEEGVEDIHSQVEIELTKALGRTGGKIHAGRSRNDQVLVDIRLLFRQEIRMLAETVEKIAVVLLQHAEKYKDVLLPGYTHTQIAMVSSFGLWLASWAESFIDDLLVLDLASRLNNRNPLGTAAGFGSSLPVDRDLTTKLLCFDGLTITSGYAQLSRGKTDKSVANAISAIATTLGSLANDLILYNGQNHSFIELPEYFSTGSSIMPQKRNPDLLELIRGRCNRLVALPNEISILTANLQSGYHRDFQLLKQILFPAFNEIKACIFMIIPVIEGMIVNNAIFENPLYQPLLSVNEVNRLVMKGKPMREAYREVSEVIGKDQFPIPSPEEYTHKGSIGNLCLDELEKRLSDKVSNFKSCSAQELLARLLKDKIE